MKLAIYFSDLINRRKGEVNATIKAHIEANRGRKIDEDNTSNETIIFGNLNESIRSTTDMILGLVEAHIDYDEVRVVPQSDIMELINTLHNRGFNFIINNEKLLGCLKTYETEYKVHNVGVNGWVPSLIHKGVIEDFRAQENEHEYKPHITISAPIVENKNKVTSNKVKDMVNHPSHYTEGRVYEPIKVINDWKLSYCIGNCLKYLSRLGRKDDAVQDINKALFYLLFESKMKGLTKEQAYSTVEQVFEK